LFIAEKVLHLYPGGNNYVLTSHGSSPLAWEKPFTQALDDVNMNFYNINNVGDFGCTGQASFAQPPHVPDPILGTDAASKGYVESLVG
jgi:hypothetical protein